MVNDANICANMSNKTSWDYFRHLLSTRDNLPPAFYFEAQRQKNLYCLTSSYFYNNNSPYNIDRTGPATASDM